MSAAGKIQQEFGNQETYYNNIQVIYKQYFIDGIIVTVKNLLFTAKSHMFFAHLSTKCSR
jgi:hypothetical protein